MAEVRHGTLVATTVTTVTLGQDWDYLEVVNRNGTAEIYFTVGGATPTVGGADCEVVPAAIGAVEVKVNAAGPTVVKLISAGTPAYTVRGG
jgi:hypothetical protein